MSARHYLLPILIFVLFATPALAQDTLYVYGGPGTLEGKFQDAAGLPDRQGWIGIDMTGGVIGAWHIDTYRCANLDPAQPQNHAWWCGEMYEACDENDPLGGYGINYSDPLEWYGAVPDTTVAVTVTVQAMLNHDVEPGYDYLYLYYETDAGWQTQATYNGTADSFKVEESFVVYPEDFVTRYGFEGKSIHLCWYVRSDGAYSDEDCNWPTAGAAQIDRIEVFFDQGTGPVQIGATETCEPGDPQQWQRGNSPVKNHAQRTWLCLGPPEGS